MGYPFIALYGAFPPHRRSVYLALDHKVDGGQSGLDILVNNIVVGGGEYFNRYSLLSEAFGGVQVLCTEVWDRRCASLRLVLPPGHWPSGAPALLLLRILCACPRSSGHYSLHYVGTAAAWHLLQSLELLLVPREWQVSSRSRIACTQIRSPTRLAACSHHC